MQLAHKARAQDRPKYQLESSKRTRNGSFEAISQRSRWFAEPESLNRRDPPLWQRIADALRSPWPGGGGIAHCRNCLKAALI
jgi:hypothetical protein